MELGLIAPPLFRAYIEARFESTGRRIERAAVDRVLDATLDHPYATQELSYFCGKTPEGLATSDQCDVALEKLLRAEHAHFGLVWERPRAPPATRAPCARA